MKNWLFLIVCSTFLSISAQTENKTYLTHGYSNNGKGYNVCELIVHPDSTYTFKSYKVAKRKEWGDYKESKPKIDYGKIKKDGDYFLHTKYENEEKTNLTWFSKISDKKIILFNQNDDGFMKKLSVYRRINVN